VAIERSRSQRLDQAGRISDTDRNQAVELLRHHCGEGILTLDEFGDRVTLVYEARTRADLDEVLSDLPAEETQVPEVRRRRVTRWAVAILGGHSPKGRIRLAETTNVVAVMGGVELDLRNAEIDGDEVVINALALMGGVEIYVPEGISVDFSALPLLGGTECKIADVPIIPGSPRIVVRAVAVMGGVEVYSRKTPTEEKALRAKKRAERAELLAARALGAKQRAADLLEKTTGLQPAPSLPVSAPRAKPQAGLGIVRVAEAVASHWNELSAKAAPAGTVTVVFSEIDGFAELEDRVGQHDAVEVLRRHNELVQSLVKEHGGWMVGSEADAFLVAFGGASRAMRFAKELQKAVRDDDDLTEPVELRMALHAGEADGGAGPEFLDRVVLRCAAVGCETAAGEILVTRLLRDLASSSAEFHFGTARKVVIHPGEAGEEKVEVAALEWR
jgi:class 3 adenylate cyclase